MTITLIALMLVMACLAGWLVWHSVNVRPWVAGGGGASLTEMPGWCTVPRVGLGVFLAVVTSVFALTLSAYVMRMAASPYWEFLPQPNLVWVSTALLVAASIALQLAWRGAARGRQRQMGFALAAGALSTLAFMLVQYMVWRQLNAGGFYLNSNPASAFFVLMTSLHALHMLGGLWVLAGTLQRVWRGATAMQVRESIALCAVYWHYLLLVWIVLFVVLFVGAQPLFELCRSL